MRFVGVALAGRAFGFAGTPSATGFRHPASIADAIGTGTVRSQRKPPPKAEPHGRLFHQRFDRGGIHAALDLGRPA